MLCDQVIQELWWDRGYGEDSDAWAGRWHVLDLTAASGGPIAASDPTGYGMGNSQHVVFADATGRIHEFWWDADMDARWHHDDLTAASDGAPLAAGSIHGSASDSEQFVVFGDVDGQLHGLQWTRAEGRWRHRDIGAALHAPSLAGYASGFAASAGHHVVYAGADDHLHRIEWARERRFWGDTDLTRIGRGVPPNGSPAAAAVGGHTIVAYADVRGHLHALLSSGAADWKDVDLTSSAGAPDIVGDPAVVAWSPET